MTSPSPAPAVACEDDLARQALALSQQPIASLLPCCRLAYERGRTDALAGVLAHLDRLERDKRGTRGE